MSLKKKAKAVQKAGVKNSRQDSVLAHINPQEAQLLKMFGGSGRTDPKTGLKHFDYGGGGMGDGGYGGGGEYGGGFGGGGFGGGDAPGDYGGWGDGGLGGLGEGSPSGGPGGNFGGFGDPGDGFGGYGGWGDSADLGGGFGADYSNEGLNYSGAFGLDAATNSPVNSVDVQSPDFLSRLQKFMKNLAMNKAIGTIGQSNPVLGTIANIVGPVAANQLSDKPNEQTPIGQQIAGRMVDAIAAPVTAPVSAINGLLGLAGINTGWQTPGQGLANANLDYKGMPAGQSGFGNSTTGQTGTGFDKVLNGVGTLAGLYGAYKGYSDSNKAAGNLSSMFGPNSPYAQQLKQSLERRDAAAGRRSQYGPREVELQAKLASMANSIAPNILANRQYGNQQLMNMLGMLTSANKMGVFDPMKGWLGSMFSGSGGGDSYIPSSSDLDAQYSDYGYGG